MWSGCLWRIGQTSLLGAVSNVFLRRNGSLRLESVFYVFCSSFSAGVLTFQPTTLVFRPILYSIAGLGIAIVNDFKSVEGDRAMGLQSLPVAFGIDTAKWICAASVTLTQLGVAGYLATIGETTYVAILLALILPQIYFQATLLIPDPVANDVKYQAQSQPFFVFGILATALCLGHHDFSAVA